jgi:hypothetical protein
MSGGPKKYLMFGREDDGEGECAPWWPLYIEDGPQAAASPEAACRLIAERLALGGETHWVELVAVPVEHFQPAALVRFPSTANPIPTERSNKHEGQVPLQ